MTGPDRRSLGQLAYENYVRTAGVGGRVLGWGAIEPSTRGYWRQQSTQAANRKARELFAASHAFATRESLAESWDALPSESMSQWKLRARSRLKTELIVAAQNAEERA